MIEQTVVCVGSTVVVSESFGGFLMQTVTVEDPFHVRYEARFFGPPHWTRYFVSKLAITGFHNQTFQDVPVWYNKRYLDRAVLVQGDGPIQQFRRWTRDVFFSPSSPTWATLRAQQEELEW